MINYYNVDIHMMVLLAILYHNFSCIINYILYISRPCIANTIAYCEEAEVKCPYRDSEYTCESTLQEREIKAVKNLLNTFTTIILYRCENMLRHMNYRRCSYVYLQANEYLIMEK